LTTRITGIDMEGRVPPLVFFLMVKLTGGQGDVVITDEEMERMSTEDYELETWHDVARCQTMYRLKKRTVVDGEVVDDVVQERRSITDGN
jgi:hypothetical protein